MIEYGIQLFRDADDVSWHVARGAHAVVLQEVEKGRAEWKNSDAIDKLRSQYMRRSSIKHSTPKKATDKAGTATRRICNKFNAGDCAHAGDHVWENTNFRHICAYCYKSEKKAFPHAETECRRKRRTPTTPTNNE